MSIIQGFTRDVRESSGWITASPREQQVMLLAQPVAEVEGGNALMHLGLRRQARQGHALQASKAPRQACMQISRCLWGAKGLLLESGAALPQ